MKHIVMILCLLCLSATALTAQTAKPAPREFEMKEGDTTYVMKRYYLGIYMRGEKAMDFSEAELEKIQAGHMAHIGKLADAGKVAIAGPFGDDTDWRGVLIFDVETQEEAEALVSEDPAVKAGRLRMEIHPWWAAKGSKLP